MSKAADPDADPYFGAFIAAMGMLENGCKGNCKIEKKSFGEPPDVYPAEHKAAIRKINKGLEELATALSMIGDPELIDTYNNMKISYSPYHLKSDPDAYAWARYKFQSITFFGGTMTKLDQLNTTITVFHEFRHLQKVNHNLWNTGRFLSNSIGSPIEKDAENWAIDKYNMLLQQNK